MLRLVFLLLFVIACIFAGYKWTTSLQETTSEPAKTYATGTPREVYCKLPVARTAGGAAQIHTNYEECMQKSELPKLNEFSPEQQNVYGKMGLGR